MGQFLSIEDEYFFEEESDWRTIYFQCKSKIRKIFKKNHNMINYWKKYEYLNIIFETLVQNYNDETKSSNVKFKQQILATEKLPQIIMTNTAKIFIDENTIKEIPFFDWIDNKEQIMLYSFDDDYSEKLFNDIIIFKNTYEIYCLASLYLIWSKDNNDEFHGDFYFSRDIELLKKKYLEQTKKNK